MLSVWCVHGEKKQNTRDKKGYKNYLMSANVMQGGTGDDDTA